jgi:transposase
MISKDISDELTKKYNVTLTPNHISRFIRDENITYKRVQKENIKVKGEQFNFFWDKEILKQKIKTKDNRDIISVDEMHIWFNDTHNYGRSKANTKCIINTEPKKPKECFSLISAINNKQTIAETLVRGTVNTEIFTRFITDSVLPLMTVTQQIILDNARIHHSEYFETIMLINGLTSDKIIYNVPYAPKYNPIEYVFNPKKQGIRRYVNNETELINFLETYDTKHKQNYENYYRKSFNHLFDDDTY